MKDKFYLYVILYDEERIYKLPFDSEKEQKAALSLGGYMPYEADITDTLYDEDGAYAGWELLDENYQILRLL